VKSSDLQQKKSKKEREHEHSTEIWNRISPKTPWKLASSSAAADLTTALQSEAPFPHIHHQNFSDFSRNQKPHRWIGDFVLQEEHVRGNTIGDFAPEETSHHTTSTRFVQLELPGIPATSSV
jgi:hypothetical protein